LNTINEIGKEYYLNIDVNMIMLMIISYYTYDNAVLYMNGQLIERIYKFKCLGSILNDKWNSKGDVKIKVME